VLSNSPEKETVRKSLSTLFWTRNGLAGRFPEFSGVVALYTSTGDVLRYRVTPCLIPCEIVMHEMQMAAFMQSLAITANCAWQACW